MAVGKSIARFLPFKQEMLSEAPAILTNDDILKFCLVAATDLAEKYCDTNLYQRDVDLTEYIDGDGSRKLRLLHAGGNVPLINTSVTVYTVADDGTQTLVPAADYRVDPDGFLMNQNGIWTLGERNYRVDHNPGWDADNWETALITDATWAIPLGLEKATMHTAAWDYKQNYGAKGNSMLGIQSKSTQDVSLSFQTVEDFLPIAAAVFKRYRRKRGPF